MQYISQLNFCAILLPVNLTVNVRRFYNSVDQSCLERNPRLLTVFGIFCYVLSYSIFLLYIIYLSLQKQLECIQANLGYKVTLCIAVKP